jgi:hypothetical protein
MYHRKSHNAAILISIEFIASSSRYTALFVVVSGRNCHKLLSRYGRIQKENPLKWLGLNDLMGCVLTLIEGILN